MIVYRTLDFELNFRGRLLPDLEATGLLGTRNVVLFEKHAYRLRSNMYCYRGMVRWSDEEDFVIDPVFLEFKDAYCSGFESVVCNDPERYFSTLEETLLRLPYPATKWDFFSAFPHGNVNMRQQRLLRYNDIIVRVIMNSGSHDAQEIFKTALGHELQKAQMMLHLERTVPFANEIVLRKSILELCSSFRGLDSQLYMSPKESLQFVKNWCAFQDLDLKRFAVGWLCLMDKISPKRNALLFQGEVSSGKNFIAESIIEASNFVGQVDMDDVCYRFDKCTRKRLIVLLDQYFDVKLSNQLMHIIEGSATTVCMRNDSMAHLLRTPVLILTQNTYWKRYPQLQQSIRSRLVDAYTNLKPYGLMNERRDKRRLHPAWLSLLIADEKIVRPSNEYYQQAHFSSSEATIGISSHAVSRMASLPASSERVETGYHVSFPRKRPGSEPNPKVSNESGKKIKKQKKKKTYDSECYQFTEDDFDHEFSSLSDG